MRWEWPGSMLHSCVHDGVTWDVVSVANGGSQSAENECYERRSSFWWSEEAGCQEHIFTNAHQVNTMVSIAVFKLWTITKHPDMSNINTYALYSDPLHFYFVDQGSWSSLGIKLFLIQRTSRLKWVSKVPWGTSLVPWLLPSSSSYILCDQNDGKELGNEAMRNVMNHRHD